MRNRRHGLGCFGVSALRARLALTIAHISASPPLIPDSRFSRVRLAASDHWLIHHTTFPYERKLKCTHTYTPRPHGLPCDYPKAPFPPLIWALSPMMVSSFRQSLYREPLHLRAGVTSTQHGIQPVSPSVTPALSLIRAHAPDLNPLTASVLPLYHESLQVAARPCWK